MRIRLIVPADARLADVVAHAAARGLRVVAGAGGVLWMVAARTASPASHGAA